MNAVTVHTNPLTPEQRAARRRAERVVDDTYPGQYVAYTEVWNGDDAEWRVLAAAQTAAEFQHLLATLDPITRRRVRMTRIPPADVIEVPSAFLD